MSIESTSAKQREGATVLMRPEKFRKSTMVLVKALLPAVRRILEDPNTVFIRPMKSLEQRFTYNLSPKLHGEEK